MAVGAGAGRRRLTKEAAVASSPLSGRDGSPAIRVAAQTTPNSGKCVYRLEVSDTSHAHRPTWAP